MEPSDLRSELAAVHSQGFAWALRCCGGDRTEAEDVLHSVYVKILEGKAKFAGRSTFRTWLFGVIRVTAREHARRRWLGVIRLDRWTRERRIEQAEESESGTDDDVKERLNAAMDNLSKRQREVLHLVFYQDLTIREAAEVLGLPVGTARTHYERGKTRLRSRLGIRGGHDES